MKTKPKIIVICGPTATGKSDLAVSVALYVSEKIGLKCEVISADSRQVYKGLDLGTGKITLNEMKGIEHHLLDIVEPLNIYSVSSYKDDSKKCIEEIFSRNAIPIICGGTGLYIDAAVGKLSLPGVPPNPLLREKLEQEGLQSLLKTFYTLNANRSHFVDLNNKRRVIRAIEILTAVGKIPEKISDDYYNTLYVGLDNQDSILKGKIIKRINCRIEKGMIQESINLLDQKKLTFDRMHKLGLEYSHIATILENLSKTDDLGETNNMAAEQVDQTKSQSENLPTDFKEKLYFAIWHYVKRQRTWFKRNKEINWFTPNTQDDLIFKLVKKHLTIT